MDLSTVTEDKLNEEIERLSNRSKKLKVILKQLNQSKEKINQLLVQQLDQLDSDLKHYREELKIIDETKIKIDEETKKRKKQEIRDHVHQLFIKYINDPNRSFNEERVIDRSVPKGKTHYFYEWKGIKIEYIGELTFRYDDYDVFFKTTIFVDGKLVANIEY